LIPKFAMECKSRAHSLAPKRKMKDGRFRMKLRQTQKCVFKVKSTYTKKERGCLMQVEVKMMHK
jgi:hypothetical protein